MTTEQALDLIEDKTATVEDNLTDVRRATQTDFPDWPEALQAARAAADTAASLLGTLVAEARAAGVTWEQVGKATGMSKQAAHQRYTA